MLCQNCGENEANVRYTQIINGVKKEFKLCDKCAKKLGVGSFEVNMPINFSNFLGNFFTDYDSDMIPTFAKQSNKKCKTCGETYEEFIETGLLGCQDCYDAFDNRLEPIIKKLQGSVRHVGRGLNNITRKENEHINKIEKVDSKTENVKVEDENKSKLDKLNEELKLAVAEERYEDAASLRDQIKKLESQS